MMKALVLAAGEGKRMGPLTENRPKPMLPVAGKPFLEHSIMALKDAGIEEIVILTGYHGVSIKEHFGNGSRFGVDVEYLVQPKRLGTANAVEMARDVMKGPFICVNGDVILSSELVNSILKTHMDSGSSMMTLIKVEDASRFGLVEVEGDLVKGIVEKSGRKGKGLVNGGIYLFNPSIFDAISETQLSPRGEYEITRSLEILMEREEVRALVPDEPWVDIGSPWDLLNANEIYMREMEDDVKGSVEDCVHVKGTLALGRGSVIKSGSYIEGNVIIDEDCVIGPNAYIRGSTYIGKGCKVGAASEIKNSIIMEDTSIPHHNYVGDSIIGSGCNLGSGTKVANLRLDDRPVPVTLKGRRMSTGRRKFGVILGDDVKTGINATMDPGTIIFGGSRIGPGTHVSGTVMKGSRIF